MGMGYWSGDGPHETLRRAAWYALTDAKIEVGIMYDNGQDYAKPKISYPVVVNIGINLGVTCFGRHKDAGTNSSKDEKG